MSKSLPRNIMNYDHTLRDQRITLVLKQEPLHNLNAVLTDEL